MRNPRFVMIMGAPLTGRHALASELSKLMRCEIISSKGIRQTIYPGKEFNTSQNDATFTEVLRRAEKAFSEGRDVIMVGMNRKYRHRKPYLKLASDHGYEEICVYCTKSLKSILKTNRERLIRIADEEIKQRFRMMSPPPPSGEGWDAVYKVNINNQTYRRLNNPAECSTERSAA